MPTGRLLLAATPIGNPGDASDRLRDALATTPVIAAEDTRRLRRLATALDVDVPGRILSFFEHNEAGRVPQLVGILEEGSDVLVVTDAGMPSVSDPGYSLVAACIEADIPVTSLPGPSAVTTALVLSGLDVDRFCFDGFPPRKPGKRKAWLTTLATEARTCVFFESPHRLAATLADAEEVLGPHRRAAVCRELTKTHEEVLRGTVAELAARVAGGVRGEIVVVLAGVGDTGGDDSGERGDPRLAGADDVTVAGLVTRVEERVAQGERLKSACAAVVADPGALTSTGGRVMSKNELYQAVLTAREGGGVGE